MPRANGWSKDLSKQINSSSASRSIELHKYFLEDIAKAQKLVWKLLERIKGIGQHCNQLEDGINCY